MEDDKGFNHFLLKINERLTLMYTHHIPNGKDLPNSYRDMLFELYRIYDSGVLEDISREPLAKPEQDKLKGQPDLFSTIEQ